MASNRVRSHASGGGAFGPAPLAVSVGDPAL